MPTLRRGASQTSIAARSRRPQILLETESPYANRRVVVECDGVTTAAYLHSSTPPIAATWIANHVPAPATTDLARLNAGQAPLMPAAHTKHPDGRPLPEPGALRALWLEERGRLVIPECRPPPAVPSGRAPTGPPVP